MQNFIKAILLLSFLVLSGCKDNSTSTNSAISGNIVGYVSGTDTVSTNGFTDANPNAGFRIAIDGTNYSTTSDNNGRWEMTNIPAGTYDISFTKDGFAMEKAVAYKFVGNGTDYLGLVNLSQTAQRNATLVLRPFSDYQEIQYDTLGRPRDTVTHPYYRTDLSCRISRNNSDESITGNAVILFSSNSNMNPLDPHSYSLLLDNSYYIDLGYTPDISGYIFSVYRSQLLSSGFKSGDKVYCQAFVSNISKYNYNDFQRVLAPSYFDIATGKQIYTCFGGNHSIVGSFILP